MKLKFIDNRAYCLQNNSNDTISIRPGNQILSINKYSIDSLLDGLYKITSNDGFILTGKRWYIEQEELMYMFVLFFNQPDVYNIEYIDRDSQVKNENVKALLLTEIESNAKKNSTQEVRAPKDRITLDFLSQSTALLKISLFMNWKKGKKTVKFKNELKKSFLKVDSSNVENLIIDLRGNGGGRDEYGLNLFSYLYDKPIIEFNRIEYKTRKTKYLEYSSWKKMWLNKNRKLNDSTFVEVKEKTLRMYEPSFPQFKGELFILINGGCYSTTGDFSAIAKSYQIGTIIGEETGSAYYGNNSGSTPFFTLPNTKIKIRIPIAKYTTNVKPISDIGRGTIPDYHVEPSIQDLIKGIDTEMNFTLDLIEEEN